MPESKRRGKSRSRVGHESEERPPTASPRLLVPAMITFFVVGLLWIVLYYVAPDMPVIGQFGGWNMVIGFGFILIGFGLSTKWR